MPDSQLSKIQENIEKAHEYRALVEAHKHRLHPDNHRKQISYYDKYIEDQQQKHSQKKSEHEILVLTLWALLIGFILTAVWLYLNLY